MPLCQDHRVGKIPGSFFDGDRLQSRNVPLGASGD